MNDSIVEGLLRTSQEICALVEDLSSDSLAAKPSPDEWSIEEIFEHVRASDSIICPRVYQVLLRSGAPLPAVDERRLADLVRPHVQPLNDRLAAYASSRRQLVSVLRSLGPAEWTLSGQHETKGEVTILDLLHAILDHETVHLDQIVKAKRELAM